MKRKRIVLNIMALLVIMVGGFALTSSSAASTVLPFASTVLPFDKCKAKNGAECEGETCCANATMCSTDEDICEEMAEEENK